MKSYSKRRSRLFFRHYLESGYLEWPKLKIEAIVEYLKTDMRRALEAAVKEAAPEATFNSHALFRSFRRAVRRKCNVWETVPDDLLEK